MKILLSSHEHLDHAGGLAELKRLTHARLVAMAEEVPTLTSGTSFPAVTPDRVIHDGDTVKLGGVTMTAHSTPGHTRGCTTWTMVTQDGGKPYNVVFLGSASVLPMYKLIDRPGNPSTYPGIEADYEKDLSRSEIAALRRLPRGAWVVLFTRAKTRSDVQESGAESVHRSGGLSSVCRAGRSVF